VHGWRIAEKESKISMGVVDDVAVIVERAAERRCSTESPGGLQDSTFVL